MKSGLQTTEAWITFAIVAVGLVIASGLLPVDSTAMKIAGLAAAVLKALAYTWSRTMVKTTDAQPANDNTAPVETKAVS